MSASTSPAELEQLIQSHGLSDAVICLHASLKSFGFLPGGPAVLIQAFLQARCSLLAPTFTYDCEVPIPLERQILQNAYNPADIPSFETASGYDPSSTMIARDMGAIPAQILQMPGRMRSQHPLNSFAAVGPQAEELIRAQHALNVYGPYKLAYQHYKTFLVLAGVGLTSATPIHFAEEKAGRRLFRRWAKNADGSAQEVEVGSCSDGFNNLLPHLKHIEIQAQAGQSLWRIYPLRTFIDTVAQTIRQIPSITHCPDPGCERCKDAIQGGPIL